jgi:hypothetical protein
MKKQLVLALGLAVLATPALATKARLQALGEDVDGSFYINSTRNIFLNAAHINNHKDVVTFEWGNTVATGDINDPQDGDNFGQDTNSSPRGEGGLYRAQGNFVYGLHLGKASSASNAIRSAAGVSLNTAAEKNNIDFFLGGDAGIKWGANIGYSRSADAGAEGNGEQQALRSRLGIIAGDLEGFANIELQNTAEDETNEFDGDLSYQVGAIYNLHEYRLFIDYTRLGGEASAAGEENDISFQQIRLAAGRITRINDRATLFTRAQFTWAKAENEGSDGAFGTDPTSCSFSNVFACEKFKTMRLPLTIGFEYDATSWLILRASVSQSIWGREEDADNKRSLAETTQINAGATFRFGEFYIDGVIGNSSETGVADFPQGQSTAGGNGTLRSDVLMSRVSMTYRF